MENSCLSRRKTGDSRKGAFITGIIRHFDLKPNDRHENTKEIEMKTLAKICLIAAATTFAGCANTSTTEPTETASVASSTAQSAAIPVAAPGTITVQVDGFETQEGQVSIALFDEAGYKGGAPLRGQNADVNAEAVTLNFEGLPAGEYGIKMYHDVDANGKMNANAFGIPSEPFAFSNNAKGSFGPAKWDAAKFTATDAGAVQKISLN